MNPPPFEHVAPATAREAVERLAREGPRARVLAGGQSLLAALKLRLERADVLVDISRLPELSFIHASPRGLSVGAGTVTAELLEAAAVRTRYPILAEAVSVLADPAVRNLGTVGGNLCHGSPENDLPAVAVALDAELRMLGPEGERATPASAFFSAAAAARLRPAEILTEVRFPAPANREGGAYEKAQAKVGDPAVAGAAARLRLGPRGAVDDAALAFTNVGRAAWRSEGAGEALVGHLPSEERLSDAAARAATEARPPEDLRGPAAYKRLVIRAVARRALARALDRAREAAA